MGNVGIYLGENIMKHKLVKLFIIISSITFVIAFVITNIMYLLPYFYQPTNPRTKDVGRFLNYKSNRRLTDNLSKNTQDIGYMKFCLLIPLGVGLFGGSVFTISEYVQSSKNSGEMGDQELHS